MLKKRIIPVQLLLNGRLTKTKRFQSNLGREGDTRNQDVGDPVKSSAVYNSQDADELVFLNIARDTASVKPLAEILERVSKVSFMPLAVGGGIRSYDDAAFLIKNGADKVVVNSAAYKDKIMLRRIADTFGAQALVIGIDAAREGNEYVAKSDCGRRMEQVALEDHIRACEAAGAGEFFVQSIDRDGTMSGFEIPLLQLACNAATVPVVGCGGSGHYDHLSEAFLATGISALACGSIFNYTDSNLLRAKAHLSKFGLPFKVV